MAERTEPSRTAPPYPAHWEADIGLADGTAAHVRPIRPSDADALQAFHVAQSEQSRYLRFFAPMPRLSERELTRFTHVDHDRRVALVALIGDAIVGVARYDAVGEDEAEVAFNVSDHHQGKGLGSILLEHLAAAARERGIHVFTAEVLPQNTRMLNTFTEAGYDVRRAYDDGVVMVEFRIDPTQRSRAVMAEREHRAEARAVERLLQPRSVLVVGGSIRDGSLAHRLLRSLVDSAYDGAVHVVARDDLEVMGLNTYGRISDVPGPVDVAVLALAPARCVHAVEDCGRAGVGALIVPTDGFADAGEDGIALQRELTTRARRWGMRLLGPASFGVLRTGEDPLNLSLSPRMPRPAPIALAVQSTPLAAMALAAADARGLGVREMVASGNRADVSVNDCLQRWIDADDLDVVGAVLESLGNPRKFARIARRMVAQRPLVVLRPPSLGSAAPPGHTVRTSDLPRRAMDQVLDAAGVVRTGDIDEFTDVLEMIARQGVPTGPRVGLLSNSPALGASLRGAAEVHGLQVVKERRDVPLAGEPRLVERAFTGLAATGDVDLVVVGVLDPLGEDLEAMVRSIGRIARGSGVPVVIALVTDLGSRAPVLQTVRDDLQLPPVHATPARAVRAAAGALRARRRPDDGDDPASREDTDLRGARRLVEQALDRSHGRPVEMGEEELTTLLAAVGLELVVSRPAGDIEQALAGASEIGYPVALKSTDPVLRHRADLGGVRLGIPDAVQLRHAVEAMQRDLAFSDAPFTVQRMAPPGVPVVVRSTEDPSLGPVIAFSVAGDATELLDDIAYATPPLTEQQAARLVREPRSSRRLEGVRGLPPADVEALRDLVIRVGLLADAVPELALLELYPVVVATTGVHVVGARARLAPAPNRSDGVRRTLGA
ncbi:GNAT family N-acetyltransferase [Brachybacterium sp. EF45031]|uniref:GNAT family N-acetyltransferase n=1 Tax=Brachybacterium sillae TaxID=2810536 RepID=UPI00217EB699|nr:GNAT family N-acetyltransferase [Brachybacterium sillae]MCS6710508.1 GNAT family N-acetyltransferase [Brachybacterium sillae]